MCAGFLLDPLLLCSLLVSFEASLTLGRRLAQNLPLIVSVGGGSVATSALLWSYDIPVVLASLPAAAPPAPPPDNVLTLTGVNLGLWDATLQVPSG